MVQRSVQSLGVLAVVALVVGCSTDPFPATGGAGGGGSRASDCSSPNDGCPCTEPGQSLDCGRVEQRFDDYVVCSMGKRTCRAGAWSTCEGDHKVSKATAKAGLTFKSTTSGSCANACDPNPSCTTTTEDAVGVPVGSELSAGPGGVSLSGGSMAPACTGLAITPATTTMTVTQVSPIVVSPANQTFTAQLTPAGCYVGPLTPLWETDAPDAVTMSAAGVLTIITPVARTVTVKAYANGSVATATVDVVVNVKDVGAVPAGTVAVLDGPPTVAETAQIIYPYANTVLPMGLLPQTVQWTGSTPAEAYKVTMRYPVGTGAKFKWVKYFTAEPTIAYPNVASGPRFKFPAAEWAAFEQSAQGQSAELVIQRTQGANLRNEVPVTIAIAPGKIKGTVHYNSYDSAIAGGQGAVLKIAPGAATPTVLLTGRQCHACHAVSANGNRAFTQDTTANGIYDDATSWDITAGGASLYRSYTGAGNNKFSWGAIYPDGSMAYSNSSDINFFAEYAAQSNLYRASDRALLATTGMPTGASTIHAGTPAFSPDGRKIAFSFEGGGPWGTVTQKAGKNIVVADFNCNAPVGSVTCGATPWTWSNPREVHASATQLAGFPSFFSDSTGLVFEQKTRAPGGPAWYANSYLSQYGSQAELWMASASATASRRLDAANGSGALPQIAPHVDGTVSAYDGDDGSCATGSAAMRDDQMNYQPTVLPQTIGGYHWVVFSSRRMYGNILTRDPFRCPTTNLAPPQKKLWVTAVDKNWNIVSDPSHPAFYLDGQELAAANSRGFWALSPCTPVGSPTQCSDDTDCCGGSAIPKTAQCRIDIGSNPVTKHCQNVTACAPTGNACVTTSDCCDPAAVCVANVCTQPVTYAQASFTRDFTATCGAGQQPKWSLFEWQATIPAGTSIAFDAQTSDAGTAAAYPTGFGGAPSVSVGTAVATTAGWTSNGTTIAAALGVSRAVLRITFTLKPNAANTATPTLTNWRVSYDCVAAE